MKFHPGLLFAVLAFPLHAQQFTEKIDVSLVNVDVTVISRGEPVRGLTRDDFEVLEDGVAQSITNFYEIGAPASSPAGPAASTPPSDDRFRRRVLVIVDNAHSSRHGRDVALGQLERFIDERFSSGEYEWSVAVTTRRVHLLLPPTTNKAAIHDAFKQVRKMSARGYRFDQTALKRISEDDDARGARLGFEASFGAWQQSFDTRDSVAAIVQAVRAFTNSPGRKIILLITGGLGTTGEFSLIPFDAPPLSAYTVMNLVDAGKIGTRLRDVLVREANASNVSFYVLNPEGLQAPGDLAGGPMTNNAMSFWIAQQTGGRMLPGNDVKLSLQEFDRTSANFYSLAYRPPHGEDGKYHRIEVRLKRPGRHSLHYRNGYVNAPAEVQLTRTLASPLAATLQSSAFPVTLTTGAVTGEGKDAARVPLTVSVPYRALQSLPSGSGWSASVDVFVSVFDEGGNHINTTRFSETATAPAEFSGSSAVLTATKEVRLAARKPHRIVVAVRDAQTGAVGMAETRAGAE
jgi:VWFA-related protein